MTAVTHFFLAAPTPNPAHTVRKQEQMATATGSPCEGWITTLMVILANSKDAADFGLANMRCVVVCPGGERKRDDWTNKGLQNTVKTRLLYHVNPVFSNYLLRTASTSSIPRPAYHRSCTCANGSHLWQAVNHQRSCYPSHRKHPQKEQQRRIPRCKVWYC